MLTEMLSENVMEILDKEKNRYLKDISIFVYCGGKSGSKTLWKSLPTSLHVHSNADFQLTRLDEDERELTVFDVIKYNMETKKRILIIDSYRTPIERKISAFFHHIETILPDYKEETMQRIIDKFNSLLHNIEEYQSIDEVFQYFNLPTFKTFNFQKKYNLKTHENITFVKIRFNEISEWSNILSTLFNIKITIKNYNLTEKKEINLLYNEFKNVYKIPKSYLSNQLVKDVSFKIYNSKKEQAEYIEKWLLKSE